MVPLSIDRESETPLYRQIAHQVSEAIVSGRMRPEDRLPTSRALATSLGVNRLTVTRAYQELNRGGLIVSRVGDGTWVREGASGKPGGSAAGAVRTADSRDRGVLPWSSILSRALTRQGESPSAGRGRPGTGETISFAWLFPDPDLYPVEEVRRSMQTVLRRDGRHVLGYGPPGGYSPLRSLIAADMRQRGMDVAEEEIVITNGSQQAIDLLARALVDPGDPVCVEDPTYLGAVEVFQSYRAELSGIPVDHEGAVVRSLAETCDRRRPKLAYVMPDFQNPTSRTMSLARRVELVALAASKRLVVIEDDFDSELRYEGNPLPSLKSLDRGGCVAYVSTFGKKLLPGLRVGWLAAPRPLAERCILLKKITDYSTSVLLQAAVHELCQRGAMKKHLARVIEAYRERRDVMLGAMQACFPPGVTWTRPEGGLVIWVTLPHGVDADGVAADAEARSVLVGRGDLFYLGPAPRGHLRLAFSQASPRAIERGIEILGSILNQKLAARPHSPGARGASEALEPPLPLI